MKREIEEKAEGKREKLPLVKGYTALDDVKADAVDMRVSADARHRGVKIKKGKKVFHRAILE